jgi:L-lactate dehydrogenase complex protein LldE
MPVKVQLFVTCIIDSLYPDIGFNVIDALEYAGIEVEFPLEQTCCGQPAFNAGLRHLSKPMAEHFINTFTHTEGPIVAPSGSCTAMVKHGYKELFSGDKTWFSRVEAIADRIFELSEFLVDYLGILELGAHFPARIAYHPSCHLLRDLGVNSQPCDLLKAVDGAELVELPHSNECCGFGGVFSAEQPEVSTAMLERKIKNMEESKADFLVTCDAGCMTHINGGLRRLGKSMQAVHIAQVLANRSDTELSLK